MLTESKNVQGLCFTRLRKQAMKATVWLTNTNPPQVSTQFHKQLRFRWPQRGNKDASHFQSWTFGPIPVAYRICCTVNLQVIWHLLRHCWSQDYRCSSAQSLVSIVIRRTTRTPWRLHRLMNSRTICYCTFSVSGASDRLPSTRSIRVPFSLQPWRAKDGRIYCTPVPFGRAMTVMKLWQSKVCWVWSTRWLAWVVWSVV